MRTLVILFSMALLFSCSQNNRKQENTEEQAVVTEVREEVLHIGKMHCEMCVASVEKGLGSVEGVEFVKVSLEDSTATVRYNASDTNREELRLVVEKRGYVLKDNKVNN